MVQRPPTVCMASHPSAGALKRPKRGRIDQTIVLSGGTLSLSGDFFKRNQLTGSAGSSDEIKDYFSYFQLQLQQPLLAANTLKIGRDQARFSVQFQGGVRYYAGKWDGETLSGPVSTDAAGKNVVASFELRKR